MQVTKEWLQKDESDVETHQKLEQSLEMLAAALRLYTTQFILNENGLLNSATLELSSHPLELMQHLFVSETNWSEPADIGKRRFE